MVFANENHYHLLINFLNDWSCVSVKAIEFEVPLCYSVGDTGHM